jgi:photosystem II stability/assembly factor-like uncharacterized protein
MSARTMWWAALAIGIGLCAGAPAFAAEQPEAPRPALPAAKATHARLLGIAVVDGHLAAVGQQGVILRSADGRNWQQLPSPVSSMLTRVRFLDARHGWIVGYDGTVLGSSDGGASWKLLHFDSTARALHDVLFTDPQHGIAIGAYGTMLTTGDGGAHWIEAAPMLADLALHLNAIIRLGDGSLLIAGERGLLAHSTDGGASWRLLKSPYVGSWFGALAHGEKGALLYGMRGHVFETDDVPALPTEDSSVLLSLERETPDSETQNPDGHWRQLANPVTESLFGGARVGTSSAVLVGVNGTIVRVDLANASLKPVEKLNDEPLSEAALFDGKLIVVGRRGVQNLGALP